MDSKMSLRAAILTKLLVAMVLKRTYIAPNIAADHTRNTNVAKQYAIVYHRQRLNADFNNAISQQSL